jgi:hypothetical protein
MSKSKAEEDLGRLIFRLNPYTNRDMPDSDPVLVAGPMDIYCSSPKSGKAAPDVSQIEVELDGPYRQEWTFKGEPQKVGMAYRIKYRFPVYEKPEKPAKGETPPPLPPPLYWLEDYVLIGFEGGMGG